MRIAHPIIMQRMLSMFPNATIVFYEIPLLSEVDYPFDLVWYLECGLEDRVRRIMRRDGIDEESARRIIRLQKREEELKNKADLVLKNTSDLNALRELVKAQYCSILSSTS